MERTGESNAKNKQHKERGLTLGEAIRHPGDERQQQEVCRVPEVGRWTPPAENQYREECGHKENESRFRPAPAVPVRPTKKPCGEHQWRDHKNAAGIADPPRPPSFEG